MGIETCVLRAAVSADWPGPEKPIRRFDVTINLLSTLVEDVEVELADGTRVPVSAMDRHEEYDGNVVFIQDLVTTWLRGEDGRKYVEGRVMQLPMTPPMMLYRDEDKPRVRLLRCTARMGRLENFVTHTLWEAPAEWVFVKHLPDGEIGEPEFFKFADLERVACEFRNHSRQCTMMSREVRELHRLCGLLQAASYPQYDDQVLHLHQFLIAKLRQTCLTPSACTFPVTPLRGSARASRASRRSAPASPCRVRAGQERGDSSGR